MNDQIWLLLATGASMFWGITYVFNGQILKYISVPTTIAIHAFAISIIIGLIAFFTGSLKADVQTIIASRHLMWLLVAGTITFAIAELFICFSIAGKNATLAGLIEISYPLFTALFAYILFREMQLTIGVALGGVLVFLGVAVIYWFGR